MLRTLLLTISLLCSSFTYADSKSVQVDLIVFANQAQQTNKSTSLFHSPFGLDSSKATLLSESSNQSMAFFQLLKPSNSELKDEYYRLSHNPSYKVLAQYSWKQPDTNKKTIVLPFIKKNGWQIQGTVRVRQRNYYLLDTKLHCSPPNNPESHFVLKHKQRLKNGMAYYFDHPQIGMILKIHS